MLSSPDFDIAIGERLKAVREKARLLQPDFAVRLGISPRAYANYERGERTISAEAIRALHEIFNVDPVWLLSGPGTDPKNLKAQFRNDLLIEIIVRVEEHLDERHLRMPVEKKARLIVLLYQYFLTKGKVEDDHIEHVLQVSSM